MVVGREFGELNAQTSAHLPSGWTILYPLAKLRRRDFETLIETGEIHPALTLGEAERLLARFKGEADTNPRRLNPRLRVRHFKEFVQETSVDWSAADRDFIRAELVQMSLELKEPSDSLAPVNRLFSDCNALSAGSPNN